MSRSQHLAAPTGPRRSHEDFENALLASSSTQQLSSSDPDRVISFGPAGPSRSRQGSSFGTHLAGISESTSNTEVGRPSNHSVQPPSGIERSESGKSGIYRGTRDDEQQRTVRSVSNAGNKGPSMGIDAELAPSDRAQIAKRRSIFRSAGTASTPDLTNRAKNGQQPVNSPAPGPSHTSHPSPKREAVEYLSSSVGPRSPPLPVDTKPPTGTVRDRSASHAPSMAQSPSSQTNGTTHWSTNTVSSRSSGVQSPKAGAGTISSRPSISNEDSFRSVRSRTRGFFGKLFSSHRDETPIASPAGLPPVRATNAPQQQLPVNVGPQAVALPPSSPVRRPPSPPPQPSSRAQSRRSSSAASQPIPPATASTEPEIKASIHPSRTASRHTRQPATQIEDDSDVERDDGGLDQTDGLPPSSPVDPTGDSTPARMDQWKRQVEGLIDGDGLERDLAMELGVPAHSMTLRDRPVTVSHPGSLLESPTAELRKRSSSEDLTLRLKPKERRPSRDRTTTPMLSTRSSSLTDGNLFVNPLDLNSKSAIPTPPDRPSRHLRYPRQDHQVNEMEDVFDTPEPTSPESVGSVALRAPSPSSSRRLSNVVEPAESVSRSASTPIPDSSQIAPLNVSSSPKESSPDAGLELEAEKIAKSAYQGEETFVAKDRLAEYLGSPKPLNCRTLLHYISQFNFGNMRVDDAFRQLCQRLYLKAETQEIDRILEAFSQRYFDCNPSSIFASPSIIHTVTGSFLLLNTDLHIADISEHMSRQQYVRLTMDTITLNILKEGSSRHASTPDLVHNDSNSTLRTSMTSAPATAMLPTGLALGAPIELDRTTALNRKDSTTSFDRASERTQRYSSLTPTPTNPGRPSGIQDSRLRVPSSASVGAISQQGNKWEGELEAALKEIYQAVKSRQILLPTAHDFVSSITRNPQLRNLSAHSGSDRMSAYKRGSIRGMPGLAPGPSTHDGRASPTPSHVTSIGENVEKHYQTAPAFGFASNLTHEVIREHEDEVASISESFTTDNTEDMTDDQLALLGPPWAKEGNLQRKPYWEAPGKRSKEKNWKQVFTVLQQGDVYMFSFDGGSAQAAPRGAVMGGGNWMKNARGQGDLNLSHALASALPPPGYNAQRPHCFSLTLASGEMSFFQAGTDELVSEWVLTCNYWAARRSRPPLPGGVSNLDYGWRPIEQANNAGEEVETEIDRTDNQSIFSTRSAKSRLSMHHLPGRRFNSNESSTNLSRSSLSDWKPPQPSLIPSRLDEETQLESLQKHVRVLMGELANHKALEAPLAKFYSPRSPNHNKAQENWKSRSHYIHSEIVKYEVYVDALQSAIKDRLKRSGERKLERSLKRDLGEGY